MKSSEKNRIQNCMTVSNVGIASVLSDPFGKTATEIMAYLLEHTSDSIDEKAVRKLIKKGAKAKSNEIIEAIRGYNIETDQAKKLELARGHLEYLDDMITQTSLTMPNTFVPGAVFLLQTTNPQEKRNLSELQKQVII